MSLIPTSIQFSINYQKTKPSDLVPRNTFFPIGDIRPLDIDYLRDIILDDEPPENSYDEIIPNLFIGDEFVATNVKKLKSLSITHIVNASLGHCSYSHVDTNEIYYARNNYFCKFLGVPASDITSFQLNHYFGFVSSFIEDGLRYTNNGKVLVHSLQGTSRSATLVVAYLMIYQKKSAIKALKLVRRKRNIDPNDGFLQQLCDLDFVLKLSAKNEANVKREAMANKKESQKGGSDSYQNQDGTPLHSDVNGDGSGTTIIHRDGTTTSSGVNTDDIGRSTTSYETETGDSDESDSEEVDKTPPRIVMDPNVPVVKKKSNLSTRPKKDRINENGIRSRSPNARRIKFSLDTKKYDGGSAVQKKGKTLLHAKPSVCKVHGIKHKCQVHPDRKRRSETVSKKK